MTGVKTIPGTRLAFPFSRNRKRPTTKEPAMNRIFNNKAAIRKPLHVNPLQRPGRQLRIETEAALRDMAFVLQLTQRVKEQILEEQEETVGA
jgi:hypothetical protein